MIESNQTLLWWSALCAVAAFNIVAWISAALLLRKRRGQFVAETYTRRLALLWLAAVYVLGCAFRSILPMVDVPRLCLHSTPMSRILIGRSVATIAELAFGAQWALLLREAGAVRTGATVLPLLGIAEILSWTAVLTRNNLFHAFENSLWTLTAALALIFFITRWRYMDALGKRLIVITIICGAGYIAFMMSVDVPMYLRRWHAGTAYVSVAQGFREIAARCMVQRDWSLWRDDALWLTLYFTLAVWLSVAASHAPSLTGEALTGQRNSTMPFATKNASPVPHAFD